MGLFLTRIGKFLLIVILVCAASIIVSHFGMRYSGNFELRSDYKMAVFGHSHPMAAFNDTIINNMINVANSAESYVYTYQKVKKLLNDNPTLEIVFIEFSNKHVDKSINTWIWGKDNMSHYFPVYSPFMDLSDLKVMCKNNYGNFSKSLILSSRKNLIDLLRFNTKFDDKLGGFKALKGQLDSDIDHYDITNSKVNSMEDIPWSNIQYLVRIVELCQSNNTKIFLIRNPQHPSHPLLSNEEKFQKIRKMKFLDIEFLDFNNMVLKNDQYADLGHLNYKGAKYFSGVFQELIESGLLVSNDKQKMINNALFKEENKISNNEH